MISYLHWCDISMRYFALFLFCKSSYKTNVLNIAKLFYAETAILKFEKIYLKRDPVKNADITKFHYFTSVINDNVFKILKTLYKYTFLALRKFSISTKGADIV